MHQFHSIATHPFASLCFRTETLTFLNGPFHILQTFFIDWLTILTDTMRTARTSCLLLTAITATLKRFAVWIINYWVCRYSARGGSCGVTWMASSKVTLTAHGCLWWDVISYNWWTFSRLINLTPVLGIRRALRCDAGDQATDCWLDSPRSHTHTHGAGPYQTLLHCSSGLTRAVGRWFN